MLHYRKFRAKFSSVVVRHTPILHVFCDAASCLLRFRLLLYDTTLTLCHQHRINKYNVLTTVTCCKCHDILKENHVFNLQQDQSFCLQSTWNASNVNMTEFCGAYTLVENFNMRDFAAIAFPRKFDFKQYQLTIFQFVI